jgi:hypothetical protein
MNSPDTIFDSPLPSAPLAEFRNFTPFPSLYFQTVDPGDNVFHVAVVRVTYTLRRSEKDGSLTLADEQTPIVSSDVNYGAVNQSSVMWESDLAPYKPRCDILLVNATAHSPDGEALTQWPVKLEVGDWQKTLHVTGPRHFKRNSDGNYTLTDAEPATQVPLTYEQACGGENRYPDPCPDGQTPEVWQIDERNPVGAGFRHDDWIKKAKPEQIRAPQLELPDKPYRGEADYPVCGFGVITRAWMPRRRLAGTYDQAWKENRWPKLPLDHDYAYWNCAPEDQQIAYPQGGETIVLHNLYLRPRVEFKLPSHRLHGVVRLNAGPILPVPLNLDTLILDLEAFRLIAVFRVVVAAEAGVRVIEARFDPTPATP